MKRIGDLYKRHFEEATEEIKRLEESSSAVKEASSRQINQLRESLQTNGLYTPLLIPILILAYHIYILSHCLYLCLFLFLFRCSSLFLSLSLCPSLFFLSLPVIPSLLHTLSCSFFPPLFSYPNSEEDEKSLSISTFSIIFFPFR